LRRISEGEYQFGTMKINIKYDFSRLLVTYGDIKMNIKEFIDMYLQQEIDKYGRVNIRSSLDQYNKIPKLNKTNSKSNI